VGHDSSNSKKAISIGQRVTNTSAICLDCTDTLLVLRAAAVTENHFRVVQRRVKTHAADLDVQGQPNAVNLRVRAYPRIYSSPNGSGNPISGSAFLCSLKSDLHEFRKNRYASRR